MDEGVFIIVALVIILGLIAGLYYVIELLSQRVFGLASEARSREQREIVNQERLARTLNELVDEVTVLHEALKTERIARSHAAAKGRVGARNASPAPAPRTHDDRKTEELPPPPEAIAVIVDAGEEAAAPQAC